MRLRHLEESSDYFNTMKDSPCLLILLFAVGFLNPVKNWLNTQCFLLSRNATVTNTFLLLIHFII